MNYVDKFYHRYAAAKSVLANPSLGRKDLIKVESVDHKAGTHAFPSGGLLRSLMAGGNRSMKGLVTLHRKFYHASKETMEILCKLAGVPDAVTAEWAGVVENCRACRTWERPQIKPVARIEFELGTNKKVFADVIYYTLQNQTLLNILHMMDEASTWKML